MKAHKVIKDLKSQNLHDHMTDLELIFTMLGEAGTTEIARRKAAKEGGTIAGDAR